MQKWEYMVLTGTGDRIRYANGENINLDAGKLHFHVFLQGLGEDGWEMVGITYQNMSNFYMFFKRPLEE